MTTITFRYADGQIVGFEAKGHAGFAESGSDIVCASVSALTQATVLGIKEVIHAPHTYTVREGRLKLTLKALTVQQRHDVDILFNTLRAALADISRAYPAHIRMEDL